MKVLFFLIFACLLFVPGTAFGWKSLADHNSCASCNVNISMDSSSNFILLGILSSAGLVVFYKITQTKKFDAFSIHCTVCGRRTNGLKCPLCEENKQKIS